MANKRLLDLLVGAGPRAVPRAPSAPSAPGVAAPKSQATGGLSGFGFSPTGGRPIAGAVPGGRDVRDTGKPPDGQSETVDTGTPPPDTRPSGTDTGAGTGTGGGAGEQPPPPSSSTDPRDSTYWAQHARLVFQLNQGLGGLDTQGDYAQQDYDRALRDLAARTPLEEKQAREEANRRGLFNSGTLGRTLGDIDVAASRSRDTLGRNKDRDDAARAAARAALEQGFPIDDAALFAEAVGRQVERDVNAPIPVTKDPKPPKKPPPGKPGFVTQGPTKGPRTGGGRTTTFEGGQGWGAVTVGAEPSKPRHRGRRRGK